MRDYTAGDLMTPNPIRLRPDERLDIALALMDACRFRHLPVEEAGHLVGILSLRDLHAAEPSRVVASAGERALTLRATEARTIMHREVVTVSPRTPMLRAAAILVERGISSLPVVEGGHLIGIVTRTDFLRPAIAALEEEGAALGVPVPVSRLMTARPVITVTPDERLDLARVLMTAERIHHLPVVEGERLCGLLSDHDALGAEVSSLARASIGDRLELRHAIAVREVMTTRVVTVAPDEQAAEAARQLLKRRIGTLPVVEEGRLVGMLSVADFFYYLLSLAPVDAAAAPGLKAEP